MRSPALIPLQILCLSLAIQQLPATADAQIVPGTGKKLTQVGDDFEDEKWTWNHNGAKASREQDEQTRPPMGASSNRRWFESPKRGQPDHIIRVETPPGGVVGSRGALKIQTLNSGVPGLNSMQMEQDDLIMSCSSRVGMISAARGPNCLTRIWLPPFDQWEDRSGSHFGYRIDLKTTISEKEKVLLFTRNVKKQEDYWPGFFIEFHSSHDGRFPKDEAFLIIRGNHLGQEIRSIQLTPGWWTLGMSVSGDGRVHFYARPGVENLTPAHLLHSGNPYSYDAEYFATHFFNVCNMNDGKTWSTPFIIDDPAVFTAN